MRTNKRAVRLLSCLVLAMTALTILLDEILAVHIRYHEAQASDTWLAAARQSVWIPEASRPAHWQAIELLEPTPPPEQSPPATPAAGTHFSVDRFGRVERGPLWLRQASAASAPNVIRIGITPAREDDCAYRQQMSVKALVSALGEWIDTDGPRTRQGLWPREGARLVGAANLD